MVNVPEQGWQVWFEAPAIKDFAGRSRGDDFQFQGARAKGFTVSMFVEAPANDRPGHEARHEH